ncbi:hypothetical protein L208DRAFT_1268484, partial [Tricholoma matsutake]
HTKFRVKRFEGPQTLRLVQIDTADNIAKEAICTIQGILSEKNLPPVTEKVRRKLRMCIADSVTLVGYGTPTFEDALDTAQEIYGLFDCNVQDASLESWVLTSSSNKQCKGIEASNQYLTSKWDAPEMVSLPIPPSIDPRRIMESLAKEHFVYGEENEVHTYIQRHPSPNMLSQFYQRVEAVSPHVFRIGDIVEIQVSFIVILLKEGKNKMIVGLQSIALLNTIFSQVRESAYKLKMSQWLTKLRYNRML